MCAYVINIIALNHDEEDWKRLKVIGGRWQLTYVWAGGGARDWDLHLDFDQSYGAVVVRLLPIPGVGSTQNEVPPTPYECSGPRDSLHDICLEKDSLELPGKWLRQCKDSHSDCGLSAPLTTPTRLLKVDSDGVQLHIASSSEHIEYLT